MGYKNWFYCVIVLLIWSSSSALVSFFGKAGNPITLSGMVVTISLIIFTSIILFRKNNREIIKKMKMKEACKLILPAILGIFLYPIAYFTGISGASPIKANILNYLWPLIGYIVSRLILKFKKNTKMKIKEIASIFLAMFGAYIVMCFNGNAIFSFARDEIGYILVAFLGSAFYGIYTAIIDVSSPKILVNSQEEKMPAHIRMFIMLIIAEIFHIIIFLVMVIIKPEIINETLINIFDKKSILSFLTYSIFNYSLAHFLWNKINTNENIHITINNAFYIPFISTLILSYTTGTEIGIYSTIGLILIVVSTIINNLQFINSINATFIGSLVLFMFMGLSPVNNNETINQNAKFFLEIIIALYSIYYGFILNRVVSEYKEFEKIIDKIRLKKKSNSNNQVVASIEKLFTENKRKQKKDKKNLVKLIAESELSLDNDTTIIQNYVLLDRYYNHALSVSEWIITLILSIAIVILCFIIRDNSILSSFVVLAIGSSICLCVSTLYEYEKKKHTAIAELFAEHDQNNSCISVSFTQNGADVSANQ